MQPGIQIDRSAAISMTGFAMSSTFLAVLNRLTLSLFPFPGITTILQCMCTSLLALRLGHLKISYRDPSQLKVANKMIPAVAALSLFAFASNELQKLSNSETIFVLYSCTTMVVTIGEALYINGRRFSREGIASLLILIGGAVSFVLNEARFFLNTYSLPVTFLISKAGEMVYMKHLVMTMESNAWNLVFYRNLLSLVFIPTFVVLNGETIAAKDFLQTRPSSHSLEVATISVMVSCLFSTASCFYEYRSLKSASATTCVMIEAVSLLPLAFIQAIFLHGSASRSGIVSLLIFILGALMYCQVQTVDDAYVLLPSYQFDIALESSNCKNQDDTDESE